MNWDAIGALGEIVGATAVVVSLVYLAVQIRTQNKEARLTSAHNVASTFGEINLPIVSDPRVAEIWNIATTAGVESLDATQATQFASLMHMIFRFWEDCYFQHIEKRLDDRLWDSIHLQFSQMRGSIGFSQFWNSRKPYYSLEFRAYVDEIEGAGVTPLREAIVNQDKNAVDA